MKGEIRKRWGAISVIWAGVILLTWSNVNSIEKIIRAKENAGLLRTEEKFLADNSKDVSEVLKKRESLRESVVGLKFGLLALESRLRDLAEKHGLTGLNFDCHAGRAGEESKRVNISFRGSLREAVDWLGTIRCDYKYIQVARVKIVVGSPGEDGKFQVSLNYRYRPSCSEDNPTFKGSI
ncbi:MAG: hypothetical protein SV775_07770 [Thermodesulfobacteriota bacterium]|nr:hypothetical protein [Thermodesulfobacteriota bacterium]